MLGNEKTPTTLVFKLSLEEHDCSGRWSENREKQSLALDLGGRLGECWGGAIALWAVTPESTQQDHHLKEFSTLLNPTVKMFLSYSIPQELATALVTPSCTKHKTAENTALPPSFLAAHMIAINSTLISDSRFSLGDSAVPITWHPQAGPTHNYKPLITNHSGIWPLSPRGWVKSNSRWPGGTPTELPESAAPGKISGVLLELLGLFALHTWLSLS